MVRRSILQLIMLFACLMAACSILNPDEVEFDIENPPDGWYLYQDTQYHYKVWLPQDWQTRTIGGDFRAPALIYPKDGYYDGYIIILPLEKVTGFEESYCDPLDIWEYVCLPPVDTYFIDVDHHSIPCARYEPGIQHVQHICVIEGPYLGKDFAMSYREISFELAIDIHGGEESTFISVWKYIVASFVLEQPPPQNEP